MFPRETKRSSEEERQSGDPYDAPGKLICFPCNSYNAMCRFWVYNADFFVGSSDPWALGIGGWKRKVKYQKSLLWETHVDRFEGGDMDCCFIQEKDEDGICICQVTPLSLTLPLTSNLIPLNDAWPWQIREFNLSLKPEATAGQGSQLLGFSHLHLGGENPPLSWPSVSLAERLDNNMAGGVETTMHRGKLSKERKSVEYREESYGSTSN